MALRGCICSHIERSQGLPNQWVNRLFGRSIGQVGRQLVGWAFG